MKIVIFGLTISSSWGNGHATLWRGLCNALVRSKHDIVFYERDVDYYRDNRDVSEIPGGRLVLYEDWTSIRAPAQQDVADADVVVVTSYCPDAIEASELACSGRASLSVFYDLDTPVTLLGVQRGEQPAYIGPRGLADFDLVLSYTGGGAVTVLRELLDARRVRPLYGHVDPAAYKPVRPLAQYRADLSYLGTFAPDRQPAVETFLVTPARAEPGRRFVIGGAQYPQDFPWSDNIFFVRHLPPPEHPAFFCSSRLTLNVTRRDMAAMGWCPSGRLFEASACGTPLISDSWDGLDAFFEPGKEILIAREAADVLAALSMDDGELRQIGAAARERVLDEHTSEIRAREMLAAFEAGGSPVTTAAHETVEA